MSSGLAPRVESRGPALAAPLAAALALVVVLVAGGATDVVPLPGIPVPDATVLWLVPALRLLTDLAAVLTVGFLFAAAVLVPGDRTIGPAAYRWLRQAGWSATVWALASLAALPVLLADFLGTRLPVITLRGVVGFVITVPQGRTQALVAVGAALVALTVRTVLTRGGARRLLLVAVLATVPPAFSGHAADDGNHELAVALVALHVVGVVVWAGGLAALLLARRLGQEARGRAVAEFSRWALPAAALVAVSGVLSSLTRIAAPDQLLGSAYGRLVLVKLAALGAVAAVGWWHRRRTLPELAAGRVAPFLRLAGVELLLFAVTIGVAVGLGRTPTPAETPEGGAAAGAVAVDR